jgi:TonB-dependent receptor
MKKRLQTPLMKFCHCKVNLILIFAGIIILSVFVLWHGQASGQGFDLRLIAHENINQEAPANRQLLHFAPDQLIESNREALNKIIAVDMVDVSMDQALKEISELAGLRIAFSKDVPKEHWDKPISIQYEQATVLGALYAALGDSGLRLTVASPSGKGYIVVVNGYISDSSLEEVANSVAQPETNIGVGTITGEVTDAATGETLPGANVVLKGTAVGVATDVDGRFTLRRVPAGTVTLEIRYLGYITREIEVILAGGERQVVNVALVGDFIEGDEIYVTALQRGQSRALTMQRQSVNIRSVVSSEQIERFADVTVEGALQRIAGMGHGGTNIRGIGAGAANVTMDGQRMGSTGSDRSVELETISVDMVQDLEVIKVITPDMDADALSGTINISTRRPIGGQRTMNVRVGGGWNSRFLNFVGPSGRISFSYGDSPREYFSYGVNLSYLRDTPASESVTLNWGIDNFEHIEGPSDVLNGLRNRITFDPRNRYSAGFQFTVQPTARSTYHFVTNLNYQTRSQEAHEMDWSWTNLISPYETYRIGTPGGSGNISYSASLDDGDIYQFTTGMGGRHLFDNFDMEYKLGWGHGRSYANDFTTSFYVGNQFEFLINFDKGAHHPLIDLSEISDVKKLTPYRFNYQGWSGADRGDRVDRNFHINNDLTGKIDFDIPFSRGAFKFGASALMGFSEGMSERFVLLDEARGNKRLDIFDMQLQRDFRIFDRSHESYHIPYVIDVHSLKERNRISRHTFSMDPFTWAESAETSFFDAHEFTYGTYGMGSVDISRFRLLGGLRMEHTDTRYVGRAGRINTVGRFTGAVDTLATNKYTHFFPNAQVVFSLGNFTQFRMAYSRSIGRPSLDQLSPYVLWNYSSRRIRQGNPYLRPMLSNNLDLLFEHYFMNVGQFSLGLFYKQMEDFIYLYTERFGAGGIDGEGSYALWHRTTFQNGEEATVYGLEVTWQQNLEFLPGFLGNIGIYTNYSYAFSEADVDRPGQTVRLVGQRPHVVNVGLDYTHGGFSGQVSYAWGAPSISSYGRLEFAPTLYGDSKRVYMDSYRDAANNLSMTMRYRLTSAFRLWADASNILNHRSINYAYNRDVYPNIQTLSGRTVSMGLQYTF